MLSKSVVAIDLRDGSYRAIQLKGSSGRFEVATHHRVDDSNPATAFASLRAQGVPLRGVSVGVNGTDASLRYNLIPPVPDWRLALIMKYEAQELADKAGEPMAAAWQTLQVPESQSDDSILLVGMGRESSIQPVIDALEAESGRPSLACPLPIAIYHASQLMDPSRSNTLLAVDIGPDGSHVSISIDGRLVFARSVSVGLEAVDDSIAASLQLDASKIAKLRARVLEGDSLPAEIASSVETAMRSAFGQYASMLSSSVSFCRAQTKIPDLEVSLVVVSGELSQHAGLRSYLERELSAKVVPFNPQLGGSPPDEIENWATAIGLALAALDPEERVLDLLPEAAKAKREFRERTVFKIAAAVILGAALLVHAVAGFLANSNAEAVAKRVKSNASTVAGYEQEQADARTKNVVLRSRLARVGGEVARPAFAARIFEALAAVLPEGVAISSYETERDDDGGRTYDLVRIEGTADDSERRGLDDIEAVQQALEQIPGTRKVESDPGDKDELRGVYPFEITVTSSEPKPVETNGRRRPRRGS